MMKRTAYHQSPTRWAQIRSSVRRSGALAMATISCVFQIGGHASAALSTAQQNAFALHVNYSNTEEAGSANACNNSSIPTTTSSSSPSANEQVAFNYFITQGLTAVQSAGIVGNVKYESASTFNPQVVQDTGHGITFSKTMTPNLGYGLSQWTDPSRQQGLSDFAAKNNGNIYDLGIQLGYIWYELNSNRKGALTAVRAASDVTSATTVFQNDYEQPASLTASLPDRIKNAQDALTLYGSSAIASGGSTTGCGTVNIGVGTGKFTTNTSVTFPGVDAMLNRAQLLNDPSSKLFAEICASQGPANCTGKCDYLTGAAWGYSNTGYDYAYLHWTSIKDQYGHPGDRNPPVGAILFYGTGYPGHAALYLGNNKVLSTDVLNGKTGRVGGVYITDASSLESGPWNLQYDGWAEPHYAGNKASW